MDAERRMFGRKTSGSSGLDSFFFFSAVRLRAKTFPFSSQNRNGDTVRNGKLVLYFGGAYSGFDQVLVGTYSGFYRQSVSVMDRFCAQI